MTNLEDPRRPATLQLKDWNEAPGGLAVADEGEGGSGLDVWGEDVLVEAVIPHPPQAGVVDEGEAEGVAGSTEDRVDVIHRCTVHKLNTRLR